MKAYIIAGAPSPDIDFIRRTVEPDAFVLCADRGYAYALQAGVKPDMVIGDFDSSPVAPPDSGNVIRLPREKDYTDTVHCIDKAAQLGYDTIVLLAATGGRLDHTLGNLCVLSYLNRRGAKGVILSRRETVWVLGEGVHRFDGRRGETFSVLPFGCESVTLSYEGAQYPLTRGVLSCDEPVGVSNVFVSDRAAVTVHRGLVVLAVNR
ncbi:MAG: thiamine diphosphokinase [Ruminococcus sp.]|nr:thiamine diphosphokinase [Ruminococcus sp.]